MLESQGARYAQFYEGGRALRSLLRFDIRYRVRRLHEVLASRGIPVHGQRVFDVGFGWGDLLASFPPSCAITGADISSSAVQAARRDSRFAPYERARFVCVGEDAYDALPSGPFDLVISSHTLEHVADDEAMLRALRARLRRRGTLAVFVPIEEPDYNLLHRRAYSLQSIAERVERAGFELVHVEGSMYVNGGIWKLVTIPSRRRWPVVRYLASGTRLGTLSLVPYPILKACDRALFRLGFGARQALVIARRP